MFGLKCKRTQRIPGEVGTKQVNFLAVEGLWLCGFIEGDARLLRFIPDKEGFFLNFKIKTPSFPQSPPTQSFLSSTLNIVKEGKGEKRGEKEQRQGAVEMAPLVNCSPHKDESI